MSVLTPRSYELFHLRVTKSGNNVVRPLKNAQFCSRSSRRSRTLSGGRRSRRWRDNHPDNPSGRASYPSVFRGLEFEPDAACPAISSRHSLSDGGSLRRPSSAVACPPSAVACYGGRATEDGTAEDWAKGGVFQRSHRVIVFRLTRKSNLSYTHTAKRAVLLMKN
jgi:hypothetical protein